MMRLGGMDYRDKAKIYIFSHQVNKNDRKKIDLGTIQYGGRKKGRQMTQKL